MIMDSTTRSKRGGRTGAPAGTPEGSSRHDVFDVLRNRRRQWLIQYLRRNDGDGPFELGELVEHVAARETGTTRAEITAAERKRVYNALRQTHLPKLDDAGMVTYDREANRIEFAAATRDAHRYLERAPGTDVPWHRWYLGLSVAVTAVIAAHWLEIAPHGGGSGSTIAGIVLSLFVITAVIHAVEARTVRGRIGDRLEVTNE
jgi:hypothetical protein